MADGLLNKASIILTPTGYKAGTLYNVAPVVEPYEDFDFARASVASRVNSSGLVEMVGRTLSSELVTNGDFLTDVLGWGTDSGAELTWQSDQTCLVETTADNTFAITQGSVLTSNTKYKVSLRFKPNNIGTFRVRLGGSSVSFSTTSFNVNQWNYIEFVGVADNHILEIGSQGGSITQFYIDNVSVKEIIDTNNIPRISYDSNGDNGHILLEPTSTNLVTYSEDFSQWAGLVALSIGLNQGISPNGSIEANLLSIGIDSSSTRHRLYNLFNFVSGDTYTYSIFAKKNENDWFQLMFSTSAFDAESYANFDLNNGVVGNEGTSTTADIIDYGNGWYRCSITCTASASVTTTYEVLTTNNTNSGRYPSYQSSAAVNVCFLWGAQLEALSYATSYIPTLTGSQEVRETETATGAGSADLINSTEGVLYAEIARAENDTNAGIISLNDGSNSNLVSIYYFSNDKIAFDILSSSPSLSLSVTTSNTSNFNKIALKYKSGDIALWVNGVEVITRTETISLSGLNNLDFRYGGTTQPFYGKVKSVAVFNEALSDSELTQLTT